ncbi:hypothetical protein BOX15_Mlig015375g1, partial [Macrostomum lignano]
RKLKSQPSIVMNQAMISQPLQHLDEICAAEFSSSTAAKPCDVAQCFLDRLCSQDEQLLFGTDASPVKNPAGASGSAPSAGARLPCLNELPPAAGVRSETLVKFRGMVQATLEPELYHRSAGLFRDRPPASQAECQLTDAEVAAAGGWASLLGERQRCLCVPVPHETGWLRSELAQRDRLEESELASLCAGLSVADSEVPDGAGKPTQAKKARLAGDGVHSWNGDSVELLVYADECGLKVHDLVETIAILSVGPVPSSDAPDDENTEQQQQDPDAPPPPSVFRLHSLSHRRLANQVLGSFVPAASGLLEAEDKQPEEEQQDDPKWSFLRNALLGVFTDALHGDSLAAEYLLLHLISAVYLRGLDDPTPDDNSAVSAGLVAVGKLSLNLTCCRAQLVRHVARLLDLLVPRLCRLPLSLGCLNSGQLTPKLDCDTCRLRPGLLQMPAHTQLVLDETALEAGRLSETGLANVRALSRLVSRQAVEFDLQMYRKDFASDLRVLVVSEGKSVLPCDVLLPLEAKNFVSQAAAEKDFNLLLEKVTLDAPFLREARRYLAGAGQLAADSGAYEIGAEQQAWIEADFVRRRQAARSKENADKIINNSAGDDEAEGATAEDLALRLVLCRLLTISLGRRRPTRAIWDRVARMEAERKRRILMASKNAPA